MSTDTLNRLMLICRDRWKVFSTVADRQDDHELEGTFKAWSDQRKRFADRLQEEIDRLGDPVDAGGTLGGGLRRGLIGFKSAVAGRSLDEDIAECLLVERFAAKDWSSALGEDLPLTARDALEHQLRETQRTVQELEELQRTQRTTEPRRGGRDSDEPRHGRADCYGLTHIGRQREKNEDHFLLAELGRSLLVQHTNLDLRGNSRLHSGVQGQLLLVADGVGGSAAGEHASAIAVDTVARYVLNMMPWFLRVDVEAQEERLEEELKRVIETCEWKLESSVERHPERSGMATTLTLAYVLWPHLYVVHVGDSRCYLQRGRRLEQITTDHTVEQRLLEDGAISREAEGETRWSHVLWKNLGGESEDLSPEVCKATLELGDAVLLCTDGLTGEVDDAEILRILADGSSAAQVARRLVDRANQNGGRDNVTVAVARFEPNP